LGRLYGWNTLGAVTGVVTAELLFIARFGVTRSAWIAGLLETGAAAAALSISGRLSERVTVKSESAPTGSASLLAAWRLVTSAFLAGGVLMALEVVWFRFLSMFVVGDTVALSLMLAIVLGGIGLGGLAASSLLKRSPTTVAFLPAAALAAACLSAASYATFQVLTEGSLVTKWHQILYFTSALTLPNAFLSGAIYTLLGEALNREMVGEVRAAGTLTLANTVGAMVGPLLAGFVMLPMLGMERSFFVLALVYGAIGVLVVRHTLPPKARAARRAFWVTALAVILALALFPFGAMGRTYFPRSIEKSAAGEHIVATREGPTETILLTEKSWMGEPLYHRLVTNGFSMTGSSLVAKRYMRFFAYWPFMLHNGPLRRALVIGYGIGMTTGAVRDLDSVESIDVVEISRDIVHMSDLLYAPDEHPLHDPRVRLHIEDGRYFLQTTDQRFDFITGEPPPPWSAPRLPDRPCTHR
jgi:predicted membrane-bound spermidine synthase